MSYYFGIAMPARYVFELPVGVLLFRMQSLKYGKFSDTNQMFTKGFDQKFIAYLLQLAVAIFIIK